MAQGRENIECVKEQVNALAPGELLVGSIESASLVGSIESVILPEEEGAEVIIHQLRSAV